MKHLLITLAIILTVASCKKDDDVNPPTHEEVTYQMALDTLATIDKLFAVIAMNPDGSESNFWWNSPYDYGFNPDGSFRERGSRDTTKVFPEPDALWIDYSITFPDSTVSRYNIPIEYDEIDSITRTLGYAGSSTRECLRVYWKERHRISNTEYRIASFLNEELNLSNY